MQDDEKEGVRRRGFKIGNFCLPYPLLLTGRVEEKAIYKNCWREKGKNEISSILKYFDMKHEALK